jgi:hypothetical protein
MNLEVLVEEASAKVALELLLPRIAPDVPATVHAFNGKPDLLTKLVPRLRGYAHFDEVLVVILVDRDREDCRALKRRLLRDARTAGIAKRVLARIAVEELEAWLLGDVPALREAFPGVPPTLGQRSRFRDPDAVAGGTAEALLEVLVKAGHQGVTKTEAARRVAARMNVEENRSHSFRVFRDGIRHRLAQASAA